MLSTYYGLGAVRVSECPQWNKARFSNSWELYSREVNRIRQQKKQQTMFSDVKKINQDNDDKSDGEISILGKDGQSLKAI